MINQVKVSNEGWIKTLVKLSFSSNKILWKIWDLLNVGIENDELCHFKLTLYC